MKFKKLSVLFACLLSMAVLCTAGCGASSQAPEAFAVSIYKVEKEQDEDGKVYITNYDLWKSYNITPTQAINLPDYDPEKEDKDCKVSYKGNYGYSRDNISGEINGKVLSCKNKIQFIPSANSIIFARERRKKTINFFYEGKNITEYLDETQLENYNKTFVNTYEERFTLDTFREWFKTFITSLTGTVTVNLYTKNNVDSGGNAFWQYSIRKYKNNYYGYGSEEEYGYDYSGGIFTLIKNTDIYIKIAESN